jgi:pimeloyl-ACP methyl ester carboxylesterase
VGLAQIAETSVGAIDGHDTIIELAVSVLAQAPERFALAGLSMGGYVALEMMRQAPHRVLALALLDTQARPDTPEASEKRRDQIQRSKNDFEGLITDLFPKMVHPDHKEDGALAGLFREMAHTVGTPGFERQQLAIMSRPDSRPLLASITCPTLVLCGRQDAITPVELHEEMVTAIPGAHFEVVENCGHLSALEQPEAVTTALRKWLGEVGS